MGTWSTVAHLATARYLHAAAKDSSGRIYAIGGTGSAGDLSSVERYDPAANTWTTVASLLGTRSEHAAASDSSGRIYAIGGIRGYVLSTVERYDPAANSWSTVASLTTARVDLAAATDSSGRIYAIGGTNASGALLATVERYDPAANTWTTVASMNKARRKHAAATDSSGRIYAIGGETADVPTVERYDPATNTWTTLSGGNLYQAWLGAAASGAFVYAIGGNWNGTVLSSVQQINPATGSWSTYASLQVARNGLAAATDSSGRIYAIGGLDASSNYLSSVERLVTNSAPNAPSWVTPQNSVIPADADAYIEIAFSDPDPGDSMSASNWKRWTLDANGNRVGSAVTTYQPTPSTKLLIPAGTLTAGTKYEFQADTLDSQGAEGPYGASLFVTAQNSPAQPTWSDPISGQTIGTSSYTGVISDPTVDQSEWTLYADNGSGGIDTATVLQGPVTVSTGDVRSHTFTGLANNVPVWWSVRVKYQGLWSQPTQIRTPVSYTPPAAPTVTLTPDAPNGALVVGITNPAPGAGEPATSYNNVYVDDGKGAGKERVATNLATNQPWTYPWPVSLRDYTGNLWVEAVATNGTTAETVA